MTTAPGPWICVDGVEGAGKTTLTAGLAALLDADTAREFSDAPFGKALREAVRDSPHYISASPSGQSLVFLGDFVELHAASVAPRLNLGRTVLTDRGYLSKHAYQAAVLASELSPDQAAGLLSVVLGLLRPPDLTIYLDCPPDVVRARLQARDGHCDDRRMSFIRRADAAARSRLEAGTPALPHAVMDATLPPDELAREAAELVLRLPGTSPAAGRAR